MPKSPYSWVVPPAQAPRDRQTDVSSLDRLDPETSFTPPRKRRLPLSPTPMRFFVHHYSHYAYTSPVTLGHHTLRLLPQGPQMTFLAHDLQIEPTPVSRLVTSDPFGNQVLSVGFVGTTNVLCIDSRFEALTEPPIAVPEQWMGLPWNDEDPASVEPDVRAFAHDLARDVGHRPLAFFDHLCRALFVNMDRRVRLEGDAQTASETLRTLRGACRDITVLFMDCCRALGVSCRFVSGYQAGHDTPDGQRYLHAWPEVFLPGYGYKGYDPTHGTAVGDGHIRLCAAPSQAQTMPVEGGFSFVGATITSTLRFGVTIRTAS